VKNNDNKNNNNNDNVCWSFALVFSLSLCDRRRQRQDNCSELFFSAGDGKLTAEAVQMSINASDPGNYYQQLRNSTAG